ncbi:MAG TPA: hypothetical protein VGE39_06790 [Prosthecobacter sp.]
MGRLTKQGSSSALRRALFPHGFAGEAMNLIHETWQALTMHRAVRHEEPITALLADQLVNEYEKRGWPWFIIPEVPVTDATFGTQLGRTDIRFFHRNFRQRVYFVVECKRLHVRTNSGFKHLADEYVDEGLLRFANNRYAEGLPCGGMVGYVMDNEMDKALDRVKAEVLQKLPLLKMKNANDLRCPSVVLQGRVHSADTVHQRTSGKFLVHHLLVGLRREPSR